MKKCPKCGESLIEIIYGMPGPGLSEAEERGEVILGGCYVSGDDPKYRCKKCDVDYSRDLKKTFKPDHGIVVKMLQVKQNYCELVLTVMILVSMRHSTILDNSHSSLKLLTN